jgi:hypothetical protein
MPGVAGTSSVGAQGDIMNITLTAIHSLHGTGWVIKARQADARLAPGGRKHPGEAGTRAAQGHRAGEAARWQRILDLLDPDKHCGAWSPATCQGHPVVCTRAPHDARDEHANAETGWRWSDESPESRRGRR